MAVFGPGARELTTDLLPRSCLAPPFRSFNPEKVSQGDSERLSDSEEVLQCRVLLTAFGSSQICPVDARSVSEFLLRNAKAFPQCSDAPSQGDLQRSSLLPLCSASVIHTPNYQIEKLIRPENI